jgi:hypothetical protein
MSGLDYAWTLETARHARERRYVMDDVSPCCPAEGSKDAMAEHLSASDQAELAMLEIRS